MKKNNKSKAVNKELAHNDANHVLSMLQYETFMGVPKNPVREIVFPKLKIKKTREDLKKYLLDNFVDDNGVLNLNGLDFSDFNGSIFRGSWKVKHHLYQGNNEVGGNLIQGYNDVKKELFQSKNHVGGKLSQNDNVVDGDLNQHDNTCKGYAYIGGDNFAGIKQWSNEKQWWTVIQEIDPYEDMSREELIALVKILKKGSK